MRFLKRNVLSMSCLTLLCFLALTGNAAAEMTVMDIAMEKTRNVFDNVRTIIFIVGGFGLVAVAFAAIFGKVNWKWFAGLAVGLAILAAAGAVVHYATGRTATEVFGATDPIQGSMGGSITSSR